jgi:cytochrome c-type biogenesis protein CcmH/NrfF
MYRKTLIITTLLLLLSLALVTGVEAKVNKYTFNDVSIDDTVVEITASVKTTNKGEFSVCDYYSDDWIDYLGQYQEATSAGDDAGQVLDFCVSHFDDRT